MKAKARIEVDFGSEGSASSAAAALESEKGFARARTSVSSEGKTLLVNVSADDVTALRAAANGMLRAVQVFAGIDDNIE